MRIAIVNDLLLAIEVLRRVVLSRPGYEIAWIAKDGAEAVQKCAQDRPELILMDLMMPVMDGVEATCRIMRETPCAVLVVTATVSGRADRVFEAMGCGALDAVATPVFGPGQTIQGGEELLTKIERISRLVRIPSASRPHARQAGALKASGLPAPLLVIGASAGGPKALSEILGQMPTGLNASIVVVQHVDGDFAMSLTDWLKSQTSLRVELASDGSRPAVGTVLVVGGNRHMVLAPDLCLHFSEDPRNSAYRPCIDAFFSSVAENWPRKDLAILLTGMGRDGAQGLLKLRQTGWHTIAQDKATSVVYGMPKAAAELDAAREVLPLPKISGAMVDFVSREKNQKKVVS